MFSFDELSKVLTSQEFLGDVQTVHSSLERSRLKNQEVLFSEDAAERLGQLVECVLSSAPALADAEGASICRAAAEVAEALHHYHDSPRMRLRSILLYELAGLPAISQSLASQNNLPKSLRRFFARDDGFSQLNSPAVKPEFSELVSSLQIASAAMSEDTFNVESYLQDENDSRDSTIAKSLLPLSNALTLEYSSTELQAFDAVIQRRLSVATKSNVDEELLEDLKKSAFPAELWPTQIEALAGGLLDSNFRSWGLAAPTGTGKTFIAQLLALDSLRKDPDKKILYVVPSRALVHEVTTNFSKILEPFGFRAVAVTPQLIELDNDEATVVDDATVVVLTPEKADMLLRLGSDIFQELSTVIIDEAHHLESATRGILLEMYLWRLKSLIPSSTRFVFLSAVTPNIGEIAAWMSDSSGSVSVKSRPTRMRAGTYSIVGQGRNKSGVVQFTDGTQLPIVKHPEKGVRRQLAQLALAVSPAGPVLIVAKGKGECENLAETMLQLLTEQNVVMTNPTSDRLERLDSRLEREMYPDVRLRKFVKSRIAYHHAGLPPRVRVAVEDAIRAREIDFVFATTTLAEGVNFPFATVIVQSLAIREAPQKGKPSQYHPVTPRVFWNLAGRAGRPGVDREGQVILFEPTLGFDKIKFVLNDYFNEHLTAAEPVQSALLATINEINASLESGSITLDDLGSSMIPERVTRRIQGAMNLIRVSLLHARASNLTASYEEILEGTFAARMLSPEMRATASTVFALQDKVVADFLADSNSPGVELAAELGLSIQTLTDLRDWVRSLENWQLVNAARVMYGGEINLETSKYYVGPIAKHMAELDGPKLGGFLSEVIMLWLSGVPFVTLRSNVEGVLRNQSIEELIALIYSRIQFLLPWGLYAADRLIEAECGRRGISYNNEIRMLAYLADSGVSSFDAMRLVHLEFERTDSQRLANQYNSEGGLRTGHEILGWVKVQPLAKIRRIVAGSDNRRIDFDLEGRLSILI